MAEATGIFGTMINYLLNSSEITQKLNGLHEQENHELSFHFPMLAASLSHECFSCSGSNTYDSKRINGPCKSCYHFQWIPNFTGNISKLQMQRLRCLFQCLANNFQL